MLTFVVCSKQVWGPKLSEKNNDLSISFARKTSSNLEALYNNILRITCLEKSCSCTLAPNGMQKKFINFVSKAQNYYR